MYSLDARLTFPFRPTLILDCTYTFLVTMALVTIFLSHIPTGSRTCPKGLNPAEAIAKMKLELAAE